MATQAQADTIVAVLTGDIVRSQRLDSEGLHQVRTAFEHATSALNERWPGLILGQPQFYRGDAWQLVISKPEMFLRVALFIRACLLRLELPADTRIAVGLGRVEELNDQSVSLSLGEAFTLSGHGLDEMGRRLDIQVQLPERVQWFFFWLGPMLSLCSTVVSRWKPKQAEMVGLALFHGERTHLDFARDFHVTRQAVSKSLTSAGWPAIEEAVLLIEGLNFHELFRVRT